MFYLSLPDDAKIGGTYDVKINGEPKRVQWRDFNTLVIQPDGDARSIISTKRSGGLIAFFCSASGKTSDVLAVPERDRDGCDLRIADQVWARRLNPQCRRCVIEIFRSRLATIVMAAMRAISRKTSHVTKAGAVG